MSQKHFFGHHHFSKANTYLQSHGRTPISWDRCSSPSPAQSTSSPVAALRAALPVARDSRMHALKQRYGATLVSPHSNDFLVHYLGVDLDLDREQEGVFVALCRPNYVRGCVCSAR
jgi:hypothetical protein